MSSKCFSFQSSASKECFSFESYAPTDCFSFQSDTATAKEDHIPDKFEIIIKNQSYTRYVLAGLIFLRPIEPRLIEIGEKFTYDDEGHFVSRERYLRERLGSFMDGVILGMNPVAIESLPMSLQSVYGDYAFPFLDYEYVEDFYYGDQRYFSISQLDFSVIEVSKPRALQYSQSTYLGVYADDVGWGSVSDMSGTDLMTPAGAGVEYDINPDDIYYGDKILDIYRPPDSGCVWTMDNSPESYAESCITGNPLDTDMIDNPLSSKYSKASKIIVYANSEPLDNDTMVAIHRGDHHYSIVRGIYGNLVVTDQGILKNATRRDVIYKGKFFEKCWISENEEDDLFIAQGMNYGYQLPVWWVTDYWHETRINGKYIVMSLGEYDIVINLITNKWGEIPSHHYAIFGVQIVYPDDHSDYKSLIISPAENFCINEMVSVSQTIIEDI